jgi:hypothetical protein
MRLNTLEVKTNLHRYKSAWDNQRIIPLVPTSKCQTDFLWRDLKTPLMNNLLEAFFLFTFFDTIDKRFSGTISE